MYTCLSVCVWWGGGGGGRDVCCLHLCVCVCAARCSTNMCSFFELGSDQHGVQCGVYLNDCMICAETAVIGHLAVLCSVCFYT